MSTEPVPAFAVSLPALWCALTLDPEVDSVDVASQVDERITREPELAPARQALLDLYLGWADAARGLGATMAAMRWDEDAAFGVAMATLVVFKVARDPARPVEVDLTTLADRLAQTLPNDQHPPRVARVAGPAGTLVRMEAVRDPSTDLADPKPLRVVIQHWIPLTGTSYMLEFESTTDNLALAAVIADEVDSIVDSLSVSS